MITYFLTRLPCVTLELGSLAALELHVKAVDERERDVLHERRVDLGDVERLLQGPDAELRDLGGAPRRALAEVGERLD